MYQQKRLTRVTPPHPPHVGGHLWREVAQRDRGGATAPPDGLSDASDDSIAFADEGRPMPTDSVGQGDDAPPKIDISAAVGTGGHEVEQLEYEDVPDTGPILKEPDESYDDEEMENDRVVNGFPPD